MKHFTHEYMKANCGCYADEPGKLEACSFMQNNPVSLLGIVTSEILLRDKFWFVCNKVATKEQNKQIAIDVAEMVLPIYEAKYPDDKRPRESVEAAKQFIAGHIRFKVLLEKRNAAYDAYAAFAADAAKAASYAANAAFAASYAANAAFAAYAAKAAAYAAKAAAYAAAADNSMKQSLLNYLISFVNTLQ